MLIRSSQGTGFSREGVSHVQSPESNPEAGVELASAFGLAIMRLSRRLRSERSDDTLELSRLSTLSTLFGSGPLSLSALAERERIQPASMTRIVSALELRGLIRRSPHPTDRRQSLIAITEAGRSIVQEDRRRRTAWLTQRVERLSPEERRRIAEVLSILQRFEASNRAGKDREDYTARP